MISYGSHAFKLEWEQIDFLATEDRLGQEIRVMKNNKISTAGSKGWNIPTELLKRAFAWNKQILFSGTDSPGDDAKFSCELLKRMYHYLHPNGHNSGHQLFVLINQVEGQIPKIMKSYENSCEQVQDMKREKIRVLLAEVVFSFATEARIKDALKFARKVGPKPGSWPKGPGSGILTCTGNFGQDNGEDKGDDAGPKQDGRGCQTACGPRPELNIQSTSPSTKPFRELTISGGVSREFVDVCKFIILLIGTYTAWDFPRNETPHWPNLFIQFWWERLENGPLPQPLDEIVDIIELMALLEGNDKHYYNLADVLLTQRNKEIHNLAHKLLIMLVSGGIDD